MYIKEKHMINKYLENDNNVKLVVKKDIIKIMKIVDEKYGKNYIEQFKTR